MSKIGYIRVSTEHQETARQQEIMDSYQVDRIFSEKLSGASTDNRTSPSILLRPDRSGTIARRTCPETLDGTAGRSFSHPYLALFHRYPLPSV